MKSIKEQAYETIVSLANSLGISKEEVNENYNDILKELEFDIKKSKYYRIKFKNGLYARLQQTGDKEVDVYSVNRKDGELLNHSDASRLAEAIRNGIDSYGFNYYLYEDLEFDSLELDE